jgi:hypothetical protein
LAAIETVGHLPKDNTAILANGVDYVPEKRLGWQHQIVVGNW